MRNDKKNIRSGRKRGILVHKKWLLICVMMICVLAGVFLGGMYLWNKGSIDTEPALENMADGTLNQETSESSAGLESEEQTGMSENVGSSEKESLEVNSGKSQEKNLDTESSADGEKAQKPVEVQQQVEAEYEKWLASAVILGVSIEYPDFELKGIYTGSCTELAASQSSEGVYVIFSSGGTELAVHSMPLEQERTTPGTIDIGTMNMGMATFDAVEPELVLAEELEAYSMEELEQTIAQTMQFSLYYH